MYFLSKLHACMWHQGLHHSQQDIIFTVRQTCVINDHPSRDWLNYAWVNEGTMTQFQSPPLCIFPWILCNSGQETLAGHFTNLALHLRMLRRLLQVPPTYKNRAKYNTGIMKDRKGKSVDKKKNCEQQNRSFLREINKECVYKNSYPRNVLQNRTRCVTMITMCSLWPLIG